MIDFSPPVLIARRLGNLVIPLRSRAGLSARGGGFYRQRIRLARQVNFHPYLLCEQHWLSGFAGARRHADDACLFKALEGSGYVGGFAPGQFGQFVDRGRVVTTNGLQKRQSDCPVTTD